MALFWLSFADPSRPRGSQFLGVAIIEAPSFMAAHLLSHALRINPGGEVMGYELPADDPAADPAVRYRLLGRAELEALGATQTLREYKDRWG